MKDKKKETDKRLWGILAVLVMAVLILLLLLAGKNRGTGEIDSSSAESASLTELSSEAASGDAAGSSNSEEDLAVRADLSTLTLEQDTNEELTALVQQYCQAKQELDMTLLGQVFGMSDKQSLDGKQEEMAHMSQLTDSYSAISCYYVAGVEEDTYVIYPYFEILYKEAEAAMPYLTWSYVKRNTDGQLYMVQDLDQEELEYVQAVSQLEEIKLLQKEVEEKQKQALEQDERLQQLFGETSREQGGSMVELQIAETLPETESIQE